MLPGLKPRTTTDARAMTWSLLALGVQALAGALLKVLSERVYGSEGLGVLFQILTVIAFTGQLGTLGVHQSLLQQVAVLERDTEIPPTFWAALALSSVGAIAVGGLVFLLATPIGIFFQSHSVGLGLSLAAPSIALLAINKVLGALLVGLERIRGFSLAQIIRAVALLGLFLVLAYSRWPVALIGLVFLGAEALVTVWLLYQVSPWLSLYPRIPAKEPLRHHFRFGLRALPGLVVAEANTKVDVLILGALLDDRTVGVYAIVSLILEGAQSLFHAVRTVLTRRLSQVMFDLAERQHKLRQYWLWGAGLGLALIPLGIAVFMSLLFVLKDGAAFTSAWVPLLVMLSGVALTGGYELLSFLPNQTGYPGRQSWLFLLAVAVNVLLCLLLVPWLGLTGAALAMVASFIAKSLYLHLFLRRVLGSRIPA